MGPFAALWFRDRISGQVLIIFTGASALPDQRPRRALCRPAPIGAANVERRHWHHYQAPPASVPSTSLDYA